MENGFLSKQSQRMLFSTVMCASLFVASPFTVLAEGMEVQTTMQSGQVSGQIVDGSGEPIIGASVLLKGTTVGTITDIDGNFVLPNVSTGTLVISYVGYKTKEVVLGKEKLYKVVLEEDTEILDEVVVMAYNTTVKRKMISSVTNVDMEQVENMSGYKDMGTALQGRVAGVLISNSQGGPDSSPTISIRGGGDPMYVIDGIVQDKDAFLRIPSQDIESLSVMKDAASSAVYGASAANGIIVVTTKKGQEGKMRVNYTFDGQYNTPIMQREKLSSYEIATMQNTVSDYMGDVKPYSDIALAKIQSGLFADYPNTDWWDLLVKKGAFSQRHTLTMDGGSTDTRYRVSFMVYDQGSLQKNVAGENEPKDYKTYSVGLNLVHDFKKTGITMGVDLRPYVIDNKSYGIDPWREIQSLSALDKVYNEDGSYAPNSPMALYGDTNGAYNKDFQVGIDANLNLDWNIPWVKGLKATFWGGYQVGNSNNKTWDAYVPTYNEDGSVVTTTKPSLTMTKNYWWKYEFNVGLKYDQSFNKHTVGVGLFYNQKENYSDLIWAKRTDYYDNVDQIFAGPSDGQTNGGSASEGGRLGYVGTLNYDYDGKYLVYASFRYDGNDGFAKGSRWGFFPSVALGYMISDEPFMEKIKTAMSLDMLKLRASIGQIGETSSRFAYLSNWAVDSEGAYVGGAVVPTASPGELASNDLTWYTTTTWNLGADFAFLNNRLSGTVDYFFRRTTGYLINPVNRYNSTLGNNVGYSGNFYISGLPKVMSDDAFRRAGAEFSLVWQDNIGKVSYSIGANLTFYDELWEKYEQGDDAVTLANPNERTTHVTIGMGDRTLLYDGLFRDATELLNYPIQNEGTSMMAGDVRYIDVNGDGVINDEDAVYDGKPRSSIMQWGIPFSIGWNGWSLEGLIQGSGPQYGVMHNNLKGTGWNKIYYKDQLDFYSPGNTDAKYPRADNDYGAWNGEYNRAASSLWLINKTYARLKNLCLSYDLKQKLLKNVQWLSTAKISLTGTNLVTISPCTKYMDPESGPVNDTGTVQTLAYPTTRTYSIVFNLGF